jgi:amino acid adenylation domain-containing protein
MLEQLRATMIELASTPLAPLAGLDLGRAAEAGLLAGWNTTPASYPADATIPALFAARVASHPEAPALAFGTTSMSYAELDRRSNALAWLLRRRGVGTDQPVGVALGRGIDLIVALLAVLKAGGAYLPVDAGNPASRIAAMIDAAGASLVLVTAETATAMPELAGVQLIHLDREPIPAAGGQVPPPDIAHPLGLAYVSFTSGSTGAPKGVGIPHRAVIRLISSPTFASLGRGQRLLHMAPAAFDASTLEIWGGLLTGGTVVIAPPGPLGLPDIAALLRDGGVTVAWLTAGLFHQLAEADINALAGVSVLLAGGDVLNPDTCRAVLAARGGKPLVNGYGPTENTTFISCHVMTDPAEVGTSVPVGRPIQHTTVHILDEDGQQVPIGVTGELYAGGEGVARGYAGNAAATARAFVPDPSGHGGRLYRTGDLARWRADGTLEFAGRADDQIKIRGFRVEPGEAAAALRAHPDVAESVVVVAGEGEQRHLIGYVTVADGAEPGALRPSLLREFVATRLPEYLVPTGFKAVASLPLNANGKVDRAALPAPDIETSGPVSAPRGATEQRLADLWRTLLPDDGAGRFGLGREDSFFSAGGNSLSAARLMFRINEVFNVELRLAEFYDAPTLTACAALIDAAQADAALASPGQAGAPLADAALAGVGQPDGARPADGVTTRAVRLRTAAAGIARRDRSAYLVTAQPPLPGRPAGLAPHLVRLGGDWALWRSTCLRAAGFPIHLLTALADQDLAAAADAVIAAGKAASASSGTAPAVPPALARAAASTELAADAGTVAGTGPAADPADLDQATAAYSAEFAAATRRLSAALYEAAGLPALREAITWQNRHALTTGIDVLRRRGPQPAKRNAKSRQHEALVASYLQRYCAKNDTIGFFGAVAWSQIDDGHGIRVTHPAAGNALAARVTYLEGWAVRAIMAGHAAALRQWLVPRLMPFVSVDGTLLRVPLAPPVQLTPAEAAVLRACDGNRDAGQVAAAVLADPAAGLADAEAVLELLARLADRHRLAWQVDVAPQDIRPEQSMRKLLSRVTDETARGPAEAALDELTAARDELAAAGGDAQQVAAAMAGLEETFTRLAGAPATRRAGELYAGRTLAYEECLRGGDVRLGADCLDGIRAALPLVFDAARWFTTACGACYARHFEEAYQQRSAALGTDAVPFADLWLMVNNALFDQPPQLIEPAVRAVRERWAELLDLPPGARQVQLRAADLVERVRAQFAAGPLPWPTAVHHSPDLMIAGRQAAAGGSLTWVLGEVHPSVITTRYASWIEFHDNPAAVRTALRHDLREPAVWFAESGEDGATSTRLSNVLDSPGDVRLIYAHDSCGYDSAASLVLGECDVLSSSAGLLVRRRDGTFERALLAVVGDLIGIAICHYFDLTPAGGHAPRITIDDLVVSRERWRLTAADLHFADTTDEDARYLQARRWAASHGLPRHVFVRYAGERKPIYADLTSLASVELISRSVRRCRRAAGPGAAVTVTEMLPTPDQAWLTDAQGLRYGAELRLVAADQRTADQAQEG